MHIITLTLSLAAIIAALLCTKTVTLMCLRMLQAVKNERQQLLRPMVLLAVLGAVLGLAAAMRTEMNAPLLMTAAALSVVLVHMMAAMMLGVHRNEAWAVRVFHAAHQWLI